MEHEWCGESKRIKSNIGLALNWDSVCGVGKEWGFGVLGFWGRSGEGGHRTTSVRLHLDTILIFLLLSLTFSSVYDRIGLRLVRIGREGDGDDSMDSMMR